MEILMSGSDEIPRALERYRSEGRRDRGYPDLHDHVLALHRAGLLIVVNEPINKDSEMHPLVRWQYRGGIAEADRRAFLFTQATDGKGVRYDIAVLVAGLAANPNVYRIGFGRPLDEIGAAWVEALAGPIEPRVATEAPCQDICVLGDALEAMRSKPPAPRSTACQCRFPRPALTMRLIFQPATTSPGIRRAAARMSATIGVSSKRRGGSG